MLTLFTEDIYKSQNFWEWAAQHIQVIGWPALLTIAWRLRGAVDKVMTKWASMDTRSTETLAVTEALKADLQVIGSNHLSHIEKDMAELNKKYDQSLETLSSIDRGIAVLVDRGAPKARRGR